MDKIKSNRDISIENAEKRDKKNKRSKFINASMIILIIIMSFFAIIKINSSEEKEKLSQEGIQNLINELNDKNITLYGMSWCPHCKDQKSLFGENIDELDYIDCDISPDDICKELSVVPVWITPDEKIFVGQMSLSEIERISSGCDYKGNCDIPGAKQLLKKNETEN